MDATTVDTTAWTAAQKAEYDGMLQELAVEQERLDAMEAEKAAVAAAPGTLLATKRNELQAKRALREKQERDAADDAAFEDAEKKHGKDRVARIRTVEGALILRAMTDVETDAASIRASTMKTDLDKVKVHRNALKATVLHPSQERFAMMVATYPALWSTLYEARDALISGIEEEHAKKD